MIKGAVFESVHNIGTRILAIEGHPYMPGSTAGQPFPMYQKMQDMKCRSTKKYKATMTVVNLNQAHPPMMSAYMYICTHASI